MNFEFSPGGRGIHAIQQAASYLMRPRLRRRPYIYILLVNVLQEPKLCVVHVPEVLQHLISTLPREGRMADGHLAVLNRILEPAAR